MSKEEELYKCPNCERGLAWNNTVPVDCECQYVCDDCVVFMSDKDVKCDEHHRDSRCEFCKEKEAKVWVHGQDAHRVCKDCKEAWDEQPSGWWA